MRRRAHDGVKSGRELRRDLLDILVARDSEHQNPAFGSIDSPQARQRLPDPVGSVADVDDGERALPDDLDPAWPAGVAQPGPYRRFDGSGSFARPRPLHPKPEQNVPNA